MSKFFSTVFSIIGFLVTMAALALAAVKLLGFIRDYYECDCDCDFDCDCEDCDCEDCEDCVEEAAAEEAAE